MKNNDFKIAFTQNRHDVAVDSLVACLMRTANVVQCINRELGTERKMDLKLTSFDTQKCSIHFELTEGVGESLFANNDMNYAADIVGVLGGLYQLICFLRGKAPKTVERESALAQVTNRYGETATFAQRTYEIYQDNKDIRDCLHKQFSVLQDNIDLNSMSFVSATDTIVIPHEHFTCLAKSVSVASNKKRQPQVTALPDQKISILRPSFLKDLKWDFIYNDQKLSAKMNDEELLKIINHGEKFAKGDCLLVDLEITKFYDEEVHKHLITNNSYKITRFKEHIKSPAQRSLFDTF